MTGLLHLMTWLMQLITLIKLKYIFPLDLTNVIVIVHSAGGHLALWLGSRNNTSSHVEFFIKLQVPIKKIIGLAGVTDLKKMWDIHEKVGMKSIVAQLLEGSPLEIPERYRITSPTELLPLNTEQILIHGEIDKHLSVELSQEFL